MLKQFFEANDEMLDLYTNAITKAHGKIIQKFLKFANFMKQFSIKFRQQ